MEFDNYNNIEQAINELNDINNWDIKIEKIKEIKKQITDYQIKLDELTNMIIKDELNIKKKKKHNKLDFNTLVTNFNTTEKLDDKIKFYQLINIYISEVEKELFN
jgi:hypothetical protein